ncbi:MAG: prepilin-type N-terminal cleavage/methylation domain-containing protein [candidate division WOR-3 bacterium]
MERIVIRDKGGFTLIEVMIAFVIILVTMLGLLNLTAQVTAVSVKNTIRDEGIKVTEEVMAQIKALPYAKIVTNTPYTITRNLRNFQMPYSLSVIVRVNPNSSDEIVVTSTNSESSSVKAANAKTIDVTVTWQYRGTKYSHTISSLVRRPE